MKEQEICSAVAAHQRAQIVLQQWERRKDELLKDYPELAHGDAQSDDRILLKEPSQFLVTGVALLFVVLEYMRNKGVRLSDDLEKELEPILPKWKEFRHCVMHVQDEMLSARQIALLEHPDSLRVIASVDAEIGSILGGMIRSLPAPIHCRTNP